MTSPLISILIPLEHQLIYLDRVRVSELIKDLEIQLRFIRFQNLGYLWYLFLLLCHKFVSVIEIENYIGVRHLGENHEVAAIHS